VTANLCGGTVQNSISSVTLPATIGGVGRGVTFAYTGTVGNFYSF
jgi:ABC-type spermidine/putrescine transport system permease subunit I